MEEKTLEQQFIDAGRALPPDYLKMRALLNMGMDINIPSPEDADDNLLSSIYYGYASYCERCEKPTWDDCDQCTKRECDIPGYYLPQVTQFFLDNGFDVSKGNGRWGARALNDLMFAGRNTYILDCCRLLLSAGADPTISAYDDDFETALEAIDFEGFFCGTEYGHHVENLYNAMVAMMEAKAKGNSFWLIEHYGVCVGRRVNSIALFAEKMDTKGIFSVHTPASNHESCYLDTVVLDCEGKMLCLSRYAGAVVDPYVPQKAAVRLDLETYFKDCVGHRITEIDFRHGEVREGTMHYGQPIVRIHLDNGRLLRFSINHGEVSKSDMVAWFETE